MVDNNWFNEANEQEDLKHREPQVVKVKFKPLEPVNAPKAKPHPLEILNDVQVNIDVVLGTTRLTVRDILDLKEGSIIELNRVAGDPVDVLVNDQAFATGEVTVINDLYSVRVSDLASGELEQEE